MEKPARKAVLDTNVLISAFVFPSGIIREIFELAIKKEFKLIVSTAILAEYARVLMEKFLWQRDDVGENINFISRFMTVSKPEIKLNAVKTDETDNRIIECALWEKARYIISGDKHLLELKKYKTIQIIKPADFLKKLAVLRPFV